MNEVSADRGHARNRDAISLLGCKWMIGRLQLDKGRIRCPAGGRGSSDLRAWIERQLRREPSEERSMCDRFGAVKRPLHFSKLSALSDTHASQLNGSSSPRTGISREPRTKKFF
jgi:hypothetical protein